MGISSRDKDKPSPALVQHPVPLFASGDLKQKTFARTQEQLARRLLCAWSLLQVLFVLMSIHMEAAAEVKMEEGQPPPGEHETQSLNPDYCDVTFDIPRTGSLCSPAIQASPPATQEELDHLKTMLADTGGILKNLQDAAALEAGESRYQDIVSEALPDVREANGAFHEILGKFLQELEDHIQVDDHPHVADEKKKLNEHLQIMDHMLQATGRLAERLDQASQNLLMTLNQPLETAQALPYGQALRPSEL